MRNLKKAEKTKRGCIWCTDVAKKKSPVNGKCRTACPHDKCPYTVLDKYDDYEDYMKSDDSVINISALLLDTEGSAGRFAQGARVYMPIVRQFGKDGLF